MDARKAGSDVAGMSDEQVARALARIAASDRERDAARTVASALDTIAGDLPRFRGTDRDHMTAFLTTYRPDVTIPDPAEELDAGDPPIRDFIGQVERLAHELVAQLAGQIDLNGPDPGDDSWWRCRWCGHTDIRAGRPLDREQAECLAHEAACGRRPR